MVKYGNCLELEIVVASTQVISLEIRMELYQVYRQQIRRQHQGQDLYQDFHRDQEQLQGRQSK